MANKIIVVQFPNSQKNYEYLCDESMVPENKETGAIAIFGSTFAIVLPEECEQNPDFTGKARLNEFKIVKVMEIKPLISREHLERLRPIVAIFTIDWFISQIQRRARLLALKKQLEEAVRNASIVTQLEAMGEKLSQETKALLDEYKTLI